MTSWSQDFLNHTDVVHSRVSSLADGELSLAELANTSEVEFAWEYDGESGLWHYAPGAPVA